MIEFNGELTGESRKFLLRKQVKFQLFVALFTALPFSILIVLAAAWGRMITLVFLAPIVLGVVASALPPSKKTQKIFMPKRVYLDVKDCTIVRECEEKAWIHSFDSVKKVFDYGEWYYFVFNYQNRDMYFVCQKDLLHNGTIDQFESLFAGKIQVICSENGIK